MMRRFLPALFTLIALLALPAAASAVAPTITNSRATAASTTTATLKATIDPSTAPTNVTVESGMPPGYGTPVTCTPAIAAVPASTPTEVTCNVTGLTPATTYHARFVADNGTSTPGADIAFVAAAQLPGTLGSVFDISATSARLTGSFNPQGVSTKARFRWGTSTSLGQYEPETAPSSALTDQPLSQIIVGLPAYTRIYYNLSTNREDESAILATPTSPSFVTDRHLTGITAKTSRVTYDGTSTISGTVSGAGTSGVNIDVDAQPYPYTGAYTHVLDGKTDSKGNYSLRLGKNIKNTHIRVSTSGSSIVTSSIVTLYVEPRVGLTIKKKGSKRVFTGSVRPKLGAEARAKVQRKSGKKWVTVRTLRLTSSSSASSRYTTTLSRRKRTSYRVQVASGNPGYATGVSTTRKVK